jgi:hypothetical protein
MGRPRAMSVYKPRNNPRESQIDYQVKFEEEPVLKVDRSRRSKSVSFETYEQSNEMYQYQARKRKAPERFEPEDFLRKAKEAKLRRSSTPITISPPKLEFVSVQPKKNSKQLKSHEVHKVEDILGEISEISKNRSKKSTHHKHIETDQFILSSFPNNMNFVRGKKGKHLSLFKYDKTGGILYLTPNTKKEIRQVANESNLVFFVVSGTIDIVICNGLASSKTRKLTLTPLAYIKLNGGVMYKMENNDANEPVICIFNSCPI